MTKEESKDRYTERAKIFHQAMVSCHRISPLDCVDWFADRIAELEKENKELKEDNSEWEKASDKWKSVYEITNNQLTKAKELLKRWIELYKPKLEGYPIPPIQEQTEQFLSEVEK